MKMKDRFSLRTVRKRIIMISKTAGIVLVISYIISIRLPVEQDLAFLLWLCFVILLVLAFDSFMGHFISKPIDRLSQAARKMAQLDFSSPCEIHTNDEFGELSQSLNKMAQNLQQALSQLQTANDRLEKDVEQEKRLLEERKELVDNLSHEMKPPLGVIRAYADGLLDEPDEKKRLKYADVIIAEAERMSCLITTLLDLSALENGATRLHTERFDFVEFVETVAGRLLMDVPDADYELQYELPEQPVMVDMDKGRMEQVLNNLLVNAKRNVCPGGVLNLSLKENNGILDFSIFNQGPPIPQENLSKIWTKFYRDRNSGYGGSGLGLAIVAQILSMQDLPYGAANRSEGVVFYFSVPIVK